MSTVPEKLYNWKPVRSQQRASESEGRLGSRSLLLFSSPTGGRVDGGVTETSL